MLFSVARCVWSATRRLCDTGKTVYFMGSLSKDFLTDGLEAGSEAFLILKGLDATVLGFLVSLLLWRRSARKIEKAKSPLPVDLRRSKNAH